MRVNFDSWRLLSFMPAGKTSHSNNGKFVVRPTRLIHIQLGLSSMCISLYRLTRHVRCNNVLMVGILAPVPHALFTITGCEFYATRWDVHMCVILSLNSRFKNRFNENRQPLMRYVCPDFFNSDFIFTGFSASCFCVLQCASYVQKHVNTGYRSMALRNWGRGGGGLISLLFTQRSKQ